MASRGRPPTGKSSDRPVAVYLPPEDISALDAVKRRHLFSVTGKEQYCGGVGTAPNPLIQKAIDESIIDPSKTPYKSPSKTPVPKHRAFNLAHVLRAS